MKALLKYTALAGVAVVAVACGMTQPVSGIGGTLVSGDWQVTLSSYDRSGEIVRVTVELTNVGSQAHSPPGLLIGDNYLIIDDSGRQYQPEGGNSLALTAQLITPINPGFGLPAIPFVFRVPTTASGLLFQFSGGLFSTEVVFQLERTAQDDIVQPMNETPDSVQVISETTAKLVSGDWEATLSNYQRSGEIVTLTMDLKNVGAEAQKPPNIFYDYQIIDGRGREFSPAYNFSVVRQSTENGLTRPRVTRIDLAPLPLAAANRAPEDLSLRLLAEITPEDSILGIPLVFAVPSSSSGLLFQFRGGSSAPETSLQLERLAPSENNDDYIIAPTEVVLCDHPAPPTPRTPSGGLYYDQEAMAFKFAPFGPVFPGFYSDGDISIGWRVVVSNYNRSGDTVNLTIQVTNDSEAITPLELFSDLTIRTVTIDDYGYSVDAQSSPSSSIDDSISSFGLIRQLSTEIRTGASSQPIQLAFPVPSAKHASSLRWGYSRSCQLTDETGELVLPSHRPGTIYDTIDGRFLGYAHAEGALPGESPYADMMGEATPGVGWDIRTESGEAEIALAEHLAQLEYDVAFICSWDDSGCHTQKELFGAEAWGLVDYIECRTTDADEEFSWTTVCDGLLSTLSISKGWVIGNSTLDGYLAYNLKEIASVTGYKGPANFRYISSEPRRFSGRLSMFGRFIPTTRPYIDEY